MALGNARHQKPGQSGRVVKGNGEAGTGRERDEAGPACHAEEGSGQDLFAQVLSKANMARAWKRVKANRGSEGVDGLSIAQTAEYRKTQWPCVREELRNGSYRPRPVRRVQIPKAGGGMRELGIPTVTDRLIQQAMLQVLQPMIDPTFSESSYGFRPSRRAHDAVLRAQRYVQEGRRIVVNVDLEKFFDRVNHDILMDRMAKRIADQAVLRLIRQYLNAGIMDQGVVTLRQYLPGWKEYFRLAQTPTVFRELDQWLRHRLRALQLKQWKRPSTIFRELRALGATEERARAVAGNCHRWWRNSRLHLNGLLPIAFFDRLGVPRLV